jgi:class 3 adenylate cyclase
LASLDQSYLTEVNGTVARLRAQAALLLGNAEEARDLLTTALASARRIRARGEIALVRLHLAELFLQHYPEERQEALAHLDFVIPEFRDMKMQPSLKRALRHKMEAQGAVSGDVRTSIGTVATSVQAERPNVSMHASSDGRVTLLFTDIEDSVPITEALGDQRWLGLLRLHNGILREEVRAHGGHEVKSQGDGFMIAFDGAHEALRCAVAIQRAVAGHHQLAEESIHVRIGLHRGEAVRDADDFYGRHVNLASRIADEARGGEILVSADLKELTDGGEFAFGEGRGVILKGMTGTHRVFDVRW